MRKVSKKTAKVEAYCDCTGLAFDDVREVVTRLYGPTPSDWPKIVTIEDDRVCQRMHRVFRDEPCWNCEILPDRWHVFIQAHHINGGSKGRSDEPTNIAMLCTRDECHPSANTSALPHGRILFLKWKHDRQNTNWIRLTLLRRQFLPDLIDDKQLAAIRSEQ